MFETRLHTFRSRILSRDKIAGLLFSLCGGASAFAQPFGPVPVQQPVRPQVMQPVMRPPVAGMPGNVMPSSGMSSSGMPGNGMPVKTISTQTSMCELAERHPLCVIIGERIASLLIATETIDEGPFQEFILGANVQGSQRTNARTSLDFIPNESAMKLKVVLHGVTVNQTLSQVRQAAIQSAGSVEFEVTKQVEFDGFQLTTWTPAAYMRIRQQHLGASTPMSPIPLLGPLASSIVMNAAEQRKPMTETIAAQRITQAVAPQFNTQLDKVLSSLNDQLNGDLKNWLLQAQIYPSHIATLSSDRAGLWGAAFEKEAPSSAKSGIFQPVSASGVRKKVLPSRRLIPVSTSGQPSDGASLAARFLTEADQIQDRVVLLVHESLIVDIAERYELGGKGVPPSVLDSLLRSSGDAPQGPSMGTLVLHPENPVSATINGGEFLLTVKAGFKPVIGPEIPPCEVVFSFRPVLTETEIILKPELASIEQLDPAAGGIFGAAGQGILKQAIEQRLKEYTLPRTVNIPREANQEPVPLRLQSLTLNSGWLSVAYEPAIKVQRPAWQSTDGSLEDALLR